jgi:exopolysaccharide biosynthesis polyprenyl glycosylphosphotransferase
MIVYIGILLVWNRFYNPVPFLILFAIQIVFDILWSILGNKIYFTLYPPKKTLLIYRNEIDKKRFGRIHGKPVGRLYKVISELKYDGKYIELKDKLEGFEAIFVAGVNSKCRNGILKYCKENDIPGFFLPHIGDVIVKEAKHIQSFDTPVLYIKRTHLKPEYFAVKRFSDILFSLIGIIIASPVMALTALLIKLYDRGPVIYKQTRLTKDGKEFKLLKFRSMCVDAEKDGVARLSSGEKDDRITPIGRFIRKCRIDELPQLINILKGDMSIIGPRPERPEIAEQYRRSIPEFDLRLQVKAGLTGYAQVYGKYNTDPYEKLEFDLLYMNNMSIFTDIHLMFATIGILFTPESTEGITEGSVTAMDYEYKENRRESSDISADNWSN